MFCHLILRSDAYVIIGWSKYSAPSSQFRRVADLTIWMCPLQRPVLCFRNFSQASRLMATLPPGDLANRNIDGADILGKGMQFLWLALAESKAFAERVRVAEDYLLRFALNALVHTSIIKALSMLDHKGAIIIDTLANQTALSVRQMNVDSQTKWVCHPNSSLELHDFRRHSMQSASLRPAPGWMFPMNSVLRQDAHDPRLQESRRRLSKSVI
jgi:hypothetical protein